MWGLPAARTMAWLAMLASTAEADQVDLTAAESQFKKSCGTCHVAAPDAGSPRQGPNLFGIVGRAAGTVEAFKYSPAFVASHNGIVWNEATLDRWLADPQSVIPGSVMLYKQTDPDKRRLVIEYLKTRR
jgi:cytochrome c